MFKFHRSYPLFLGGLMALGLTLSVRARHLKPEQARPLGRLSARQVLDLSAPLCRRIAPQLTTLYMAAEPTRVQSTRFWTVQCTDQAGKEIANFTWNAETGQLAHVGVGPSSPDSAPPVLLKRQEAVQKGWYWLEALGWASRAPRWHVVGQPLCQHHQSWEWSLDWEGGEWHALLQMQAHSGALLGGQIWRVRPRTLSEGDEGQYQDREK